MIRRIRCALSPSSRTIWATVSPVVSRSRIRSLRSAVARRGATRRAGSSAGGSGGSEFLEGLAMGGFRNWSKKNPSINCYFQKEKTRDVTRMRIVKRHFRPCWPAPAGTAATIGKQRLRDYDRAGAPEPKGRGRVAPPRFRAVQSFRNSRCIRVGLDQFARGSRGADQVGSAAPWRRAEKPATSRASGDAPAQ